MLIYAEVKPHHRTSIHGAQRAASAGPMRPSQGRYRARLSATDAAGNRSAT